MQDINSKRGKKHLDNGPGQFSGSFIANVVFRIIGTTTKIELDIKSLVEHY